MGCHLTLRGEQEEHIEKAKEWAAKAYTEYEDKDADNYYKLLQQRIREEAVLKAQLGE